MQKVLVIDDENLFREATTMALARRGFAVHEAANGVQGMEVARQLLPDLIICDINMEQMDGYQVLEALRQDPTTAGIPFILMTGMGDSETMRRGMNLGADDYLAKPFTAAQLYSAAEARLRKSQVLRESAERKLTDLRASLSLALPHEFITPLNGIFGLAQLLAAEAETLSPEEVSEYGRNILESAERLHRTAQSFILYGNLEIQASDPGAVAALRRQHTSAPGELLAARARHHATHAQRPEDLQLRLPAGDLPLALGQDLFTKLADELIDNAFKFSLPGSQVEVSLQHADGKAILEVIDSGHGMGAEQVARIGAYAQFDRQQKEQQGSGLGLAIARRITDLHGGQFGVQSELKRGTTVTVTLPLTHRVTTAANPAAGEGRQP